MISLRARFQKSFTRHVLRPRLSPSATLQQQRWWLDKLAGLAMLPWGCKTENIDCDGVPAEWVSVGEVPNSPVLLYLHGGGYCIGSPKSHRNVVARLAKGLGCRALVPDYRLAPEHPFPAPLLDVVKVYRWLLAQGVAPQQIVLAGDSAGGGLALASCMMLRQLGLPLPAGLFCISPWVDLSLSCASIEKLADVDPLVEVAWIESLASHYCAGEDPRHPLISPLYGHFDDFPPILIQLGSEEVLRSEVELLHARLQHAGVASQLQLGEGMWHDWPLLGGMMPEADQAIQQAVAFIAERLGLVQASTTLTRAASLAG